MPNNPVVLERVDGHALLVNMKALQAAGVTAATKDPDGGRILRDASGAPAGVFVDNAQDLIGRAIPPMSRAQRKDALAAAVAEANRWGLTGIDDAGESRETIDIYEELAKAGKLTLRAYVMISDDSADIAYYFKLGPRSALYDGHVWVRSIKLYADGALGSRGAALLDPYADDPGNIGLLVSPPEHIRAVSVEALKHGFQVATHAIGDRGNRVTLDAYAAALKEVPVADHRFRIEHAQIVDHNDIPRFAELDVIPSMQAVPPDERHVLGGEAARARPHPRRVRLARPARDRRDHPQRQRFPGGAGESALLVSFGDHAAGCEQLAPGRMAAVGSA